MNNNFMRPPMSPSDQAAMLAMLQQNNPEMFARLQAARPNLMEMMNEQTTAAAAAATNNPGRQGHGHSHNHSASCGHSHSPAHFSQPVPEPPPKPDTKDMNAVQAVQYNELERVKELIESGQTDVNTPDPEGCYLLHWAAINNHVEIIRYLIAKGAVVDMKGGDLKSTPLHWACRQGCIETFLVLVDNRAALDSTDVHNLQPIHLAAQYGHVKILAFLLGSGIHVDCPDGRQFTPLIYSCLGPPPDYTPAPNVGFVCCTQFLLTYGADINYQEPTRRFTPMHFAINNRSPISFHVLLKNPRVNIYSKNSDGMDPLAFARMRGNEDGVLFLEDRIQSSKVDIKPKFLQPFLSSESNRTHLLRLFMFSVLVMFGMAANATTYPYWIRILGPIAIIYGLSYVFNYYVFDGRTKDNFAFAYVFSTTLFMYVTYIIYLQENSWSLRHLCYHFFTIFGVYSFYCTKKQNPGFLKQQTMSIDGHNLSREKICIAFARDPRWTLEHFCVTCLIRRPLRSKHCPLDGVCVAKLDHHCTWLDACIGGRNYFHFIRILTCAMLALWLWLAEAIRHFNRDNEVYTLREIFTKVNDPWLNYVLLLNSLNFIWVTGMTGFHLYNSIYLGVTLNERLTGYRYTYFRDEDTGKFHNPFGNQTLKNFLETFGFFRLMALFRYPRIDWSQIYDINQIKGSKMN